ncbi:MAG: hypothetical protein AAF394_00020 [Planctomycetota bacterium]
MCGCNCDPCWACGTRPKQAIVSGNTLSLATPENGTYDIPAYGEETPETYHAPLKLDSHDHGFGIGTENGGFGVCSAFNTRGGPFYKTVPFPPFSFPGDVYGWLLGTRTESGGFVRELILTRFIIVYFVGGEWGTIGAIAPDQGPEDRFAAELSSRRVLAFIQTYYTTIAGGFGANGPDVSRKEFFEAELPAPCRDFSGTISLTQALSPTWSYAPATGGFLDDWGLESTFNLKSIDLVF